MQTHVSGFHCRGLPMFGFSKKPAQPGPSWSERLKSGLSRTREAIGGLFVRERIDESLYEELETALLGADCGVDATTRLLEALRARVRKESATESSRVKVLLREELLKLIAPLEKPFSLARPKPLVIMVAGVNGAGKTTSIGKLAKFFQGQGKTVLLAAGDTFRAAAREQLAIWGERNGITVVAQQSGDPSAVIFDAVSAATARGIDIVLADTAGRLPTQLHLMEEIRKVKRVIGKVMPDAPHEVILVLDANTGQNTLNQVKAFDDAVGLTGLVLTKLDGTAKGGVLAAIAHDRSKSAKSRTIPLYFVGVGEGIDDLRPFSAREFVEALID
jgi:fused signal recognition particle receptor